MLPQGVNGFSGARQGAVPTLIREYDRTMERLALCTMVLGISLLSGCSEVSTISAPQSSGLTVGDEPVAVQAGAKILSDGGSAADAAAAMYFALSVTYPVAAGLGGGGICLVHDPARASDEEIDFLVRDAARGGGYGVPGGPGGIALLQSGHGALPWQRIVAAGERLAAAGFPISHALAVRIADNLNLIRLDAGLSSELLDESGNPKAEGALASNPSLAQSLAAIRVSGPKEFYDGDIASRLVAYSGSEGGAISAADLRDFSPGRGEAEKLKIGDQLVLLPSRHVGAGAFLSAILSRLVPSGTDAASAENLGGAVAAATKTTLDSFHIATVPRDLGATGFAASDKNGQVVACAITMNGPFGSGHTAAGTGVTLARAPSSDGAGLASTFLAPAIALNDSALTLAGAGAGGPNGSAAMVYDLLKAARGGDLAQPGQARSTALEPYETANIIVCQSESCAAVPDPAAHGLGASANR